MSVCMSNQLQRWAIKPATQGFPSPLGECEEMAVFLEFSLFPKLFVNQVFLHFLLNHDS